MIADYCAIKITKGTLGVIKDLSALDKPLSEVSSPYLKVLQPINKWAIKDDIEQTLKDVIYFIKYLDKDLLSHMWCYKVNILESLLHVYIDSEWLLLNIP